jgi:uncharacterized DUF497 family protein
MQENLKFEWDEVKSKKNLIERTFDFEFASHIFLNLVLEKEDRRRDYGEVRIIATGKVEEVFITVVYTWRGDQRRIISARRSHRSERDAYRKTYDA